MSLGCTFLVPNQVPGRCPCAKPETRFVALPKGPAVLKGSVSKALFSKKAQKDPSDHHDHQIIPILWGTKLSSLRRCTPTSQASL